MAETPEIRHHRWKHKANGYCVKVLGVYNRSGHYWVQVDKSNSTSSQPRSWQVEMFLNLFQPIGRPFKEKTVWQHINSEAT